MLRSFFFDVEVYLNNQQIYSSIGLFAQKSYIANNLSGAIYEHKRAFHCEVYDYVELQDENLEAPLSELFSTRRVTMLSRPDGFMLYGKLRLDFFPTSELLNRNMKIGLRLIKDRPIFYMISENPNVSLEKC